MDNDKISAFCEHVKRKAIDPANKEAAEILKKAKEDAEKMLHDAKAKADAIIEGANDQSRRILETAKSESKIVAKLVIAKLKSDIESSLFNKAFLSSLSKQYCDENFLMPIATSISDSIKKDGIGCDVTALFSDCSALKNISAKVVSLSIQSFDKKKVSFVSLNKDKEKILIDVTLDSIEDAFWPLIKNEIRKSVFGM